MHCIVMSMTKTQPSWLQRDVSLYLGVNNSMYKSANKMFSNFLWKNKTHHLHKSVVLSSDKARSLNVIDLDSFNNNFEIKLTKNSLNSLNPTWNFISRHVNSHLEFLLCNYSIPKIPTKLPPTGTFLVPYLLT